MVQQAACWLAFALLVSPASAQPGADARAPFGNGAGVSILLTNNGFGLGGYYQRTVSPNVSLLLDLFLSAGKDDQEFSFFDRFGRKNILDKANYLLMLPAQVGVQRRLFADHIEDNFRPFVQFSFGPTLGWVSPYFDDENDNGTLDESERTFDVVTAFPKGRLQLGIGATVAVGAHFGTSQSVTQAVRIGYTFSYFYDGVPLLEERIRAPQRFFGSPTISLHIGRLLGR